MQKFLFIFLGILIMIFALRDDSLNFICSFIEIDKATARRYIFGCGFSLAIVGACLEDPKTKKY